jgi:hypothetical protein
MDKPSSSTKFIDICDDIFLDIFLLLGIDDLLVLSKVGFVSIYYLWLTCFSDLQKTLLSPPSIWLAETLDPTTTTSIYTFTSRRQFSLRCRVSTGWASTVP